MSLRLATLGCAVALLLVDLPKPLVIDDAVYYAFARHIAEHPGDPYGFQVFWYDVPQPANKVLAPPVFLYWWAAGLRLLGDHPLLWKLWAFPFALLLAEALARLLRRFAPGVAAPMSCAVLLSPAILPALNLMLDLPALALALCGLALALRACDTGRLGLALLAGLVAGLALETKYSALTPLLAALSYAALTRRYRVGLTVGAAAALVFTGWELFTLHRYGTSHFAHGVQVVSEMNLRSALDWLTALVGLLGSSGLVLAVLAQLTFGASRTLVAATAGLVTAGLLGVAALPAVEQVSLQAMLSPWPAMWIFLPLGLFVAGSLCALAVREARQAGGQASPARARDDRFILLWVAIELVGFFVVSPYPALRRLIGLQVACSFLVARALDRRRPAPRLRPLVAWGAAIGLLFAISEVTDARAQAQALDRAIAHLDAEHLPPGATRWYVGHWGFQFQAERRGLRPIVPGQTQLRPGDVLVSATGVYKPRYRIPRASLVRLDSVEGVNPWPWSALPWAYSGYPPLRPQPEVQMRVHVRKVVAPVRVR